MDLAHFRFALIAPVIQGLFSDPSIAAYCKRVTQEPITRPDGTTFRYTYKTIEKWIQLYKNGGMDALMPTDRKDKGSSRVLTDTSIEEIYRLKEKYPRLNATQIHQILIRDAFLPATVSVAAVQRFLRNHKLKVGGYQTSKDRKAFEEPDFGCLWQADTCYMPHITENGKARRPYLIMILDDHSRLIVGGRMFYQDNAYNFQKVLMDAISTYGIPDKLYCDSGAPYRNKQLSFICDSIACILLHTPVRDGASKGKVERNFRTLKNRWLHSLDINRISSLAQFNDLLADYIHQHNTTVHSSTEQTPLDRFMQTRDHIRIPQSEDWLIARFHNRISRKVRNDACISIDGASYDVPQQFIGMTVDIRYLPEQMEDAYILYEGNCHLIRKTDKVANSRTKRNNLPRIDYEAKEAPSNE